MIVIIHVKYQKSIIHIYFSRLYFRYGPLTPTNFFFLLHLVYFFFFFFASSSTFRHISFFILSQFFTKFLWFIYYSRCIKDMRITKRILSKTLWTSTSACSKAFKCRFGDLRKIFSYLNTKNSLMSIFFFFF